MDVPPIPFATGISRIHWMAILSVTCAVVSASLLTAFVMGGFRGVEQWSLILILLSMPVFAVAGAGFGIGALQSGRRTGLAVCGIVLSGISAVAAFGLLAFIVVNFHT